MKRLLIALVVVAAAGVILLFLLARPDPLSAANLPQRTADPANGQRIFFAGGCLSCHKPGEGVSPDHAELPAGGHPFATPIGTFYPPNLTPDPEAGLGKWSELDFVNAVTRGISPAGKHYFPHAFPYTSYQHMRLEDVQDLWAHLKSLPPVKAPNRSHDVLGYAIASPFIGAWKRLALDPRPLPPDPARPVPWNKGAYLVTGPGHCAECHTPLNWIMMPDESRRLAGGPHPEGKGKVPNLRRLVERGKYKDAQDLAKAFKFGAYDAEGNDRMSSGGMGLIQANLAKLPDDDLAAMAEYLLSLK
jgi:mono/diheme cytochrome c family protein